MAYVFLTWTRLNIGNEGKSYNALQEILSIVSATRHGKGNVCLSQDQLAGLEKKLISQGLVTLLHIQRVIPTPQSLEIPRQVASANIGVQIAGIAASSADIAALSVDIAVLSTNVATSSAKIIPSNGECCFPIIPETSHHDVLLLFHNVLCLASCATIGIGACTIQPPHRQLRDCQSPQGSGIMQ